MRIKNIFVFLILILFTVQAFGQNVSDKTAVKYAETITADDLALHLFQIASDNFEGREAGKPGQKKAARYIAELFESFELPEIGTDRSYFHHFVLIEEEWDKVKVKVDDEEYNFMEDFYGFARSNPDGNIIAERVYFMGYGIDDSLYSDYKSSETDVKGKVIVVYDGEPKDEQGNYLISGTEKPSGWSYWRSKLEAAAENEVKAILIIRDDFETAVKRNSHRVESSAMQLKSLQNSSYPVNFYISPELGSELIGKDAEKVKQKLTDKKGYHFDNKEDVEIMVSKKIKEVGSQNVLGYIEGSDTALKDEVIIVTAHYDHLGKKDDKIYNGADDDGSGTVAIMEMAEAFAKAKKEGNGPRRSILFMPVSAEEKGLLGSTFYVNNPLFPLENTVANLNIDMIGRIDENHKNDSNYIYIIGSDFLSSELHRVNEEANEKYIGLDLDYTYNDVNDPNRFYYRSDHYNFAKNNIPVIFYFNGTHEDYHRHTDTVEKINYEILEKRSRLIFYTAWMLANMDKRIQVDVTQ